MSNSLNVSRFSAFFVAAAGSALALSSLVSAPAMANGKDYRCASLAQQASAAADSADAEAQKVAKRFVATGNKLCESGNGRDAAKQYRSALRKVGVAEVAESADVVAEPAAATAG